MVSWQSIDTVLLDMDGTLLDLCYDNTLWTALLPVRFSEANDMTHAQAREYLFAHMQQARGQLHFYCLDYWADFTGIDIISLHHELRELIRYRRNALEFLQFLEANHKQSLLVTNAHQDSLRVKNSYCDIIRRLDATISCHDYGAPKESQEFWQQLIANHPFDPARTLLIDDNDAVLNSARQFGIRHLLTISQPDSARPPKTDSGYRALKDFSELFESVPGAGMPQATVQPRQ